MVATGQSYPIIHQVFRMKIGCKYQLAYRFITRYYQQPQSPLAAIAVLSVRTILISSGVGSVSRPIIPIKDHSTTVSFDPIPALSCIVAGWLYTIYLLDNR
jgi:hypothetical protein